ncbi:MAG: hypothetical protein A3C55_03620 [Gammaproteobacteria bacterium RIFCSPHIGHO2_02_FULL_42_13]|nr:MAG: hypothetical protein A3C55_03620 [Gammaproteobacteria bacterium RIFCSPHIGHO2_02_FULL_42_13]OGT68997.1 MAG: hypothetical protein A3H43_06405 [Gammaproteobacteria bacterium RIFCSPLOWO2_02_FULL_42_9]
MIRRMTKDDVEIIAKENKYHGYFKIDSYQMRYRLFEGGWGPVVNRELFERGHAAAVLPYDPILRKVILIEQFRIGAMQDKKSPWLLEVVAGILEPHETPEQLAARESKEEAGLDLLELTPICNFYASPGACTETVALFCGRIDATNVGGIYGIKNEAENILVHVLDVEEAFQLLHDGSVTNMTAIIALQWLEIKLLTQVPDKRLAAAQSWAEQI